MDVIKEMVEEGIDAMKVSSQDVEVIMVGGGSIILPKELEGTSRSVNPEHAQTANAIGSAISKVSGTYEKTFWTLMWCPERRRLHRPGKEAIAMAVDAGAVRRSCGDH
mgnify:CR=1 FL=1